MPDLVTARLTKTKVKRNDPAVKRLNTALKKKHGADAGLIFTDRSELPRLKPTESLYARYDYLTDDEGWPDDETQV